MKISKNKNRIVILGFVIFCLTSLALLPFYHIHTDIEHIGFLERHRHKAHQHICLIEWFASRLTDGYVDKDCENSHEEEENQTNKSQYLIKQWDSFKKNSPLIQVYLLNSALLVPNTYQNFLKINFVHSDYNFSPFCNNFSTRSPPQILI